MGQSKLNICNQALLKIGEQTITSLDEASDNAKLCSIFFDQALEEVLREYPWTSATSRAQLPKLSRDPIFGYDYAYQLPTDFIRLVQLYDGNGAWHPDYYWVIEGRTLLCNLEEANIIYIKMINDTKILDSLCTSALICKLAMRMAFSRTDSRLFVQSLLEEYEQIILPRARSIDTFEKRNYQEDEYDPWLTSRQGTIYSGIEYTKK